MPLPVSSTMAIWTSGLRVQGGGIGGTSRRSGLPLDDASDIDNMLQKRANIVDRTILLISVPFARLVQTSDVPIKNINDLYQTKGPTEPRRNANSHFISNISPIPPRKAACVSPQSSFCLKIPGVSDILFFVGGRSRIRPLDPLPTLAPFEICRFELSGGKRKIKDENRSKQSRVPGSVVVSVCPCTGGIIRCRGNTALALLEGQNSFSR